MRLTGYHVNRAVIRKKNIFVAPDAGNRLGKGMLVTGNQRMWDGLVTDGYQLQTNMS